VSGCIGPDQVGLACRDETSRHPLVEPGWRLCGSHVADRRTARLGALEPEYPAELVRTTRPEPSTTSAASDLPSATHSCGHTGHRNFKISPLQHCGVCFGCLLRRASFLASGLSDQTGYLSERTTDRPDGYLRSKSMVPSLRAFLAAACVPADLASLTLPSGYDTAAARDVCERAIRELELLFS
jgi:hypothetical protein